MHLRMLVCVKNGIFDIQWQSITPWLSKSWFYETHFCFCIAAVAAQGQSKVWCTRHAVTLVQDTVANSSEATCALRAFLWTICDSKFPWKKLPFCFEAVSRAGDFWGWLILVLFLVYDTHHGFLWCKLSASVLKCVLRNILHDKCCAVLIICKW